MEREPIHRWETPITLEELINAFETQETICTEEDPMLPGIDIPEGTYLIQITDTCRWQIVEALKQFKKSKDENLNQTNSSIVDELRKHTNKFRFVENALVTSKDWTCSQKAGLFKTQCQKLLYVFQTLEKYL